MPQADPLMKDGKSLKNTAYDEEFFRVFAQYLEEAINKVKKQQSEEEGGEEDEDLLEDDFEWVTHYF